MRVGCRSRRSSGASPKRAAGHRRSRPAPAGGWSKSMTLGIRVAPMLVRKASWVAAKELMTTWRRDGREGGKAARRIVAGGIDGVAGALPGKVMVMADGGDAGLHDDLGEGQSQGHVHGQRQAVLGHQDLDAEAADKGVKVAFQMVLQALNGIGNGRRPHGDAEEPVIQGRHFRMPEMGLGHQIATCPSANPTRRRSKSTRAPCLSSTCRHLAVSSETPSVRASRVATKPMRAGRSGTADPPPDVTGCSSRTENSCRPGRPRPAPPSRRRREPPSCSACGT